MPAAAISGFHHVALTVRVLSAGATRYERVVDFAETDETQLSILRDGGS